LNSKSTNLDLKKWIKWTSS